MENYESKQQQILLPADVVYNTICRMDNLTPALKDKVEEWTADENHCSFKAKGFNVKLQIIDKERPKYVKITGDDGGIPVDFAFWIQLHAVSEYDTRIRLVVHADLNMMMKMLIGSKIKPALDQMVEQMAASFNMAAGR